MGAGIRRFGVDGARQNFNERFQKLVIGCAVFSVFQDKAGQAADSLCESLDFRRERDGFAVVVFGIEKLGNADDIFFAV